MADETKNLWQRITQRQSQLEDARRPLEPLWEEVIRFFRPDLAEWDAKGTDATTKQSRGTAVYTSGPQQALSGYVNGILGHVVNRSLKWLRYHMGTEELNKVPEALEWLQESRDIRLARYRASNFYTATGVWGRDAASIGDGTLWVDEDEDGKWDFKTFHPQELFYKPGIFHRQYRKTAFEMAKEFGKENLPKRIQDDLKEHPFNKHKLIHACYLKDDPILEGERGLPERAYISIHIAVEATTEERKPLRMKGYHTKPYIRWQGLKPSDSDYGWGLGCEALADAAGWNASVKTNSRGQQSAANPAMLIQKGLRSRVNLNPGGRNYVDDEKQFIKPILESINLPLGLEREREVKFAVEQHFHVDFFLMLSRATTAMTATEIIEKVGERAILLAPMTDALENALDDLDDRTFDMDFRAGRLPEVPSIITEMSNGVIDVEYMGPLPQAHQRMFMMRQIQDAMSIVGPLLQVAPEERHRLKIGETIPRILRSLDWPETEIATDEEFAATMERIAAQEQRAEQMEVAKATADAVPKLSKEIEPGSAIDVLAGGVQA